MDRIEHIEVAIDLNMLSKLIDPNEINLSQEAQWVDQSNEVDRVYQTKQVRQMGPKWAEQIN